MLCSQELHKTKQNQKEKDKKKKEDASLAREGFCEDVKSVLQFCGFSVLETRDSMFGNPCMLSLAMFPIQRFVLERGTT